MVCLAGRSHHGVAGGLLEKQHSFRWTINSSARKTAWLWEALFHPSLATSHGAFWENGSWLGTTQTISVAPVRWWQVCGLVAWSRAVTEFSQPPQLSKAFHPVHYEIDSGSAFLSLDALVIKKGTTLVTIVYRKSTGNFIFKSNICCM
jgi:hypothetical protein